MKCYLSITFLLLTGFALKAQTYYPFPTKNTIWTEGYYSPYPDTYKTFHCFALKDGDTTINGKLYHKLYHSNDTIFTEDKLCGGIREDNKKIYYYSIDSLPYQYIGIQTGSEVILYDFTLKLGDTIRNNLFRISHPDKLIVFIVDSILIGTQYRKTYTFGYPNASKALPWATWVEGIGSLRGLLFATGDLPTSGVWNDVICFRQDYNILYHDTSYDVMLLH